MSYLRKEFIFSRMFIKRSKQLLIVTTFLEYNSLTSDVGNQAYVDPILHCMPVNVLLTWSTPSSHSFNIIKCRNTYRIELSMISVLPWQALRGLWSSLSNPEVHWHLKLPTVFSQRAFWEQTLSPYRTHSSTSEKRII